ncbi:MAG: hypothetical protein KOO62_05470 [candidate division Zixibacteria bacterium]|nr:hypothetical protein [candidate division Zixibacteria bacterium]
MEPIRGFGVEAIMAEKDCKTILFRFVAALTLVLLLVAPLLPAPTGAQVSACDDCDDCDDHDDGDGESVCGCIGCLPVTVACVSDFSEDSYTLDAITYSIINPFIDIECEFFDRVDRPPQTLL